MQIGLVGSGNMARRLALGWGEPVPCTDSGSGRAPGGATARRLVALERGGVRAALAQAMDDVVDFA
jgi:pyrroline-5-carboxylate reductase